MSNSPMNSKNKGFKKRIIETMGSGGAPTATVRAQAPNIQVNSVLMAAMGLTDLGGSGAGGGASTVRSDPAIVSPPERQVPSVADRLRRSHHHHNTNNNMDNMTMMMCSQSPPAQASCGQAPASFQQHRHQQQQQQQRLRQHHQHPQQQQQQQQQGSCLDQVTFHKSQLYNDQLQQQASSSMNGKSFPARLFELVSDIRHADVISWLPHGQGFIIHDKNRFAETLLPHYFDGTKFTSFTRRLKRWSFTRVSRGSELGAYYNKNFVRGYPENVKKMRYRITVEKRALAAATAKKKKEEEENAKLDGDDGSHTNDNDGAKQGEEESQKNNNECHQDQEKEHQHKHFPTVDNGKTEAAYTERSVSRSMSSGSESLAMQLMSDEFLQYTPRVNQDRRHGVNQNVLSSHANNNFDHSFPFERHYCPPPSRQHSFYDTPNSASSFRSNNIMSPHSFSSSEQRLLDIEARLIMLRNMHSPRVAMASSSSRFCNGDGSSQNNYINNNNDHLNIMSNMMNDMPASLPLCNAPTSSSSSSYQAQQHHQDRMTSSMQTSCTTRSIKHKLVIEAAVKDLQSRMGVLFPTSRFADAVMDNIPTNGFRGVGQMNGGSNSNIRRDEEEYARYMERMNCYRHAAA